MKKPLLNVAVENDGWIRTGTGGKFWPLDPSPEDVRVEDIAQALSNTCRYNRFARPFYSVAQHAVLVSQHCDPKDALWGLHHDDDEAYSPFGDIARPVKVRLPAFVRKVNERIQRACLDRFNLSYVEPASVRRADDAILYDEKRAVMKQGSSLSLMPDVKPLGIEITPWSPEEAEARFLERHFELGGQR
jgi:hypothetical protein